LGEIERRKLKEQIKTDWKKGKKKTSFPLAFEVEMRKGQKCKKYKNNIAILGFHRNKTPSLEPS
jgi:hypothetical protein